MAKIAGNTITTSGTGKSDWVVLPPRGDYMAFLSWAGGAGNADLQIGPPDAAADGEFADLLDAINTGTKIAFTADGYARVPGGASYLLDVTTHTSAATIKFVPIDQGGGRTGL